MEQQLVQGIDRAYRERSDLVVFALTGRTGSGCTTAANALSLPFQSIALSDEHTVDPERRKIQIVRKFAEVHWVPFQPITVSSVIFSFALSENWPGLEKVLRDLKLATQSIDEFRTGWTALREKPGYKAFSRALQGVASGEELAIAWAFFSGEVELGARELRRSLAGNFQPLFQRFGDNIRCSGSVASGVVDPEQIFNLMQRVRVLIAAAEAATKLEGGTGTRIVIDAIRNPLELVYLRDHFASMYAIAITVDDEERLQRLADIGLGKREIERMDDKEYGDRKQLSDYSSFVSQNLKECIQKADIFIGNPGKPAERASAVRAMNTQLVRYVALALRPGLITPTRDERCMQFAFVAKLNSGCISRQVGAAVADDGYSIQAVGWNDVPRGQVPCAIRNVNSLLSGGDDVAFSDFEMRDPKLRTYLQDRFVARPVLQAGGLPCPFCFRDAYNAVTKEKNQVHTRSLHAEENAFLQLAKRGSTGIAGGVLYTTASPCELCSKKAYQLGIREVVYVDPYPGISAPHVLSSGRKNSRPILRLFSGAVGHAYHRLYDSILSVKDELSARLSGAGKPQAGLPLSTSQ